MFILWLLSEIVKIIVAPLMLFLVGFLWLVNKATSQIHRFLFKINYEELKYDDKDGIRQGISFTIGCGIVFGLLFLLFLIAYYVGQGHL